MPAWYEYVCDNCGLAYESQIFHKIGECISDCECGGRVLRIVSTFRTVPAAEPYFNHTTGSVVTSNRDFEKQLARASAEQSERLGCDHRYVPMYPSEARAQFERTASKDGESGESVERYARIHHKPSTTRIIT